MEQSPHQQVDTQSNSALAPNPQLLTLLPNPSHLANPSLHNTSYPNYTNYHNYSDFATFTPYKTRPADNPLSSPRPPVHTASSPSSLCAKPAWRLLGVTSSRVASGATPSVGPHLAAFAPSSSAVSKPTKPCTLDHSRLLSDKCACQLTPAVPRDMIVFDNFSMTPDPNAPPQVEAAARTLRSMGMTPPPSSSPLHHPQDVHHASSPIAASGAAAVLIHPSSNPHALHAAAGGMASQSHPPLASHQSMAAAASVPPALPIPPLPIASLQQQQQQQQHHAHAHLASASMPHLSALRFSGAHSTAPPPPPLLSPPPPSMLHAGPSMDPMYKDCGLRKPLTVSALHAASPSEPGASDGGVSFDAAPASVQHALHMDQLRPLSNYAHDVARSPPQQQHHHHHHHHDGHHHAVGAPDHLVQHGFQPRHHVPLHDAGALHVEQRAHGGADAIAHEVGGAEGSRYATQGAASGGCGPRPFHEVEHVGHTGQEEEDERGVVNRSVDGLRHVGPVGTHGLGHGGVSSVYDGGNDTSMMSRSMRGHCNNSGGLGVSGGYGVVDGSGPTTPTTPATSASHPFPATPCSPALEQNGSSNGSSGLKEHACSFPGCTKTFDRRYNLTVHYRRHTDEMPYPCKVAGCAQKFKWRSSQSHHMKTRHHGVIIPSLRGAGRRGSVSVGGRGRGRGGASVASGVGILGNYAGASGSGRGVGSRVSEGMVNGGGGGDVGRIVDGRVHDGSEGSGCLFNSRVSVRYASGGDVVDRIADVSGHVDGSGKLSDGGSERGSGGGGGGGGNDGSGGGKRDAGEGMTVDVVDDRMGYREFFSPRKRQKLNGRNESSNSG